MSTLGIDYSEIGDPSGKSRTRSRGRSRRGRRQLWLPLRVVWWAVLCVVLAVLPFLLLIRGGVFAHHHWGLAPWLALAISATATTLLLALYALRASRRIGAGKGLTRAMTRAATLLAGAYVVYSVMFVAGGNVKSGEVRAEYTALHPLLRLGASALILADPDAVHHRRGPHPRLLPAHGTLAERIIAALPAGKRFRARARSSHDRPPRMEEPRGRDRVSGDGVPLPAPCGDGGPSACVVEVAAVGGSAAAANQGTCA